jgi:fumarate reductase flavoprotein subunit
MSTKVMDCDLLVIGGGGSGLVAAVKASDLTGAKIIVLEKSRKTTGGAYFGTGLGEGGPIQDSTWQKENGWEVSKEQDISGQFFDWLCTKGDPKSILHLAKRREGESGIGAITVAHRTEKYKNLPDPSIGPGKLGSFVVDHMAEACKKQGITVLTETPARRFITDKNGQVTGVLADSKDGQLLVNCKACIMAAGGYGASEAKLKKYYPKIFNNTKIHSLCPPNQTGDCMDMFEAIGGYVDPTIRGLEGGFVGDAAAHHPYSFPVTKLINNGIYVNLLGKRWQGSMGGMNGELSGLESQPGGVVYAISDSEMVESSGKEMDKGMTAGGPGGPGGASKTTPDPTLEESLESKAMKRWREELELEIAVDEAGAAGNHTKRANTLAELALKMKVDPQAFVQTIEEYNKSLEKGGTTSASSGGPGGMGGTPKPIKTGPFYAIYCHRWSQCSKGRNGVAVNSKLQALNPKGEVMPGLYAAGDTCTIFGGLILNRNQGPSGNEGVLSRTSAYLNAQKSKATQNSAMVAPGGGMPPGGGQSAGGPGGAPGGPGGPGGGMPGMGGSQAIDFKTDEGSPCGGLGPALLSGYLVAQHVAEYLKSI